MKDIRRINLKVTCDSTRKGARYTIDGIHWMNAGELAEILVKAAHGLAARKDANGAFDRVADIPEYGASVKSSGATVCNRKLGETAETSIETFMTASVANSYWYVIVNDDIVTTYKMSKETFHKFLLKFAKLNERGVLRLPKTNSAMVRWLDWNA